MEKKKKTFDLFAESSDSEQDDGDGVSSVVEKGFMVQAPSVDEEGYYQPKAGEIILNKYRILGIAGKGVFSCVVKAIN